MTDILGRALERAALEELLARARSGHSGALVLRGEAGIGKTALLDYARDQATAAGFRQTGAVGTESEALFAFAGLHQLCLPLLEHVDGLPAPQRAALGVAFGQQVGTAPDPFLVGLATLNLLAEAAEETPLLCLIDDAQWLDETSAQVLAFVARRIAAERVVLVFALRAATEDDLRPLVGLPELRLGGLDEDDAQALLSSAVGTPLDTVARERILAEAHGNPLALVELPRSLHPGQFAGGFELPDVLSVPHRIEQSFRRRSRDLPPDTQLLLLVAAADATGDPALVWRAAEHLGISPEAAVPAAGAGLLEIGSRVRFHHPLVRSAVYRAATAQDQSRVHEALAASTDPLHDPDRRAWHRARAVLGVDEEAAADLERSAGRARARGGVAAAAAFLQRATELSPDPAVRARRALAGAQAKQDAGATEAALELLAIAASGPLDALQSARLDLLRAQIAFHQRRSSHAPRLLLEAAATLTPLDPALARETYLHALDAALVTGAPDHGVQEVAEAARAAPPVSGAPEPRDLLLTGLVTTFTAGYEAGVPELRLALRACAGQATRSWSDGDDHRWLWLLSRTAMAVFDDELAHTLAERHMRLARDGALATLPTALLVRSVLLVLAGELTRAAELVDEHASIAAPTAAAPLLHAQLILSAWRGRPKETQEIESTIRRESARDGDETEVALSQFGLAVLHNGLGSYPEALEAATKAFRSDELTHSNLAHTELIEAASRAGRPELATEAMEELCVRARSSGTPWALGMAARSRALTGRAQEAEEDYLEAIDQLGQSRVGAYLARTHLLYGEWLRRERRRLDARGQLRIAHDMLTDMGLEAFAGRAARELRATGEHPRKRSAQPSDALTAHELQIARLVATGATSREVGTQLFLSPRTIEAHLRNIFRKLGITSRRQLSTIDLP